MNPLEKIITYGLTIRQIPKQVVSHYAVDNNTPPEAIIEKEVPEKTANYIRTKEPNSPNYRVEGNQVFRRYHQVIKIPERAGCWMVKTSPESTCSRVEWTKEDYQRAKITLAEAIDAFLNQK